MTEYEIFKSCFPQLRINENAFLKLAFSEDTKCFHNTEAFACCDGDRLTLLCVAPKQRGQGIGSELLKKCEDYAKSLGKEKLSISGGIIAGAAEGSSEFFAKRGYTLGGSFCEMELPLDGFTAPNAELPQNVDFRFFDGDIKVIRSAVEEVDNEWVQYFNADGRFFCCYADGELASFCIIDEDVRCALSDENSQIGSIGCVGTVPKFRRMGLGLHMVALGAQWLKTHGCNKVFIHYTHLDKWYGKLGAKVFLRFTAAEKELL
ncbi:MAG: GNAT family N-acetyltransferase [Ruminococcaceae bacterium]|nr:GNAT family N-acetyltransferase [Oscillospiraceae bacterium]